MTSMQGLLQQLLGDNWTQLPQGLQAHYPNGPSVETGHLDIAFPRWMKPYLWLLSRMGALLQRSGRQVPTRVEKHASAGRCHWRRTMTFSDGETATFNSYWVPSGENRLIEYVNPVMGLEMAARADGDTLRYDGVRYVLQCGRLLIGLPEWLVLGHTTIVERALSANAFAMDFRLTHPLFGEVFRYSGVFTVQR